MYVYALATLVCLYFFRDQILGVFCSSPGNCSENLKMCMLVIAVSFFPFINIAVAFCMTAVRLWKISPFDKL